MQPAWIRLILVLPILVMAAVLLFKRPKLLFAGFACLALLGLVWNLASPTNRSSSLTAHLTISPAQSSSRTNIVFSFPSTEPTTNPTGKLWVDDWNAYVNSAGTHRWARAGTTAFAGSEDEARVEARAQAAKVLLPYVSPELRTGRMRATSGTRYITTDSWILQQLEASIAHNDFVKDEQIRQTSRPYGDVWSCELLLDASPEKVSQAAREYSSLARRQAETTAMTWGGIGAIALVIILTYAFLNWVTKGYFVWRLRAAAAMVVILAVLAVMAFA